MKFQQPFSVTGYRSLMNLERFFTYFVSPFRSFTSDVLNLDFTLTILQRYKCGNESRENDGTCQPIWHLRLPIQRNVYPSLPTLADLYHKTPAAKTSYSRFVAYIYRNMLKLN